MASDPTTLPQAETDNGKVETLEPKVMRDGTGDDIPLSERREEGQIPQYKRSIYALPVNVQVVIGTARPTIANLLQMKSGSLVALSSKVSDPVSLCIDNRIIARGELVETEPATGELGVRLTEIVDVSEDKLI